PPLCRAGSGNGAGFDQLTLQPPWARSTSWSRFQLTLEFIEKAPVRVLGDNPVWGQLDEPRLVQPQRKEAHRILRIEVPPNGVWQLLQRLQVIIVVVGEPALDHLSSDSLRFGSAQISRLQKGSQNAFARDRIFCTNSVLLATMQQ